MQLKIWHYSVAGSRRGPVTEDAMRKLIVERTIDIEKCLVWRDGMAAWLPLTEEETFFESVELLHRLEAEKKRESSPSPMPKLGKALEERPRKKAWPSELTLALRLFLSGVCLAFLWAFMNQGDYFNRSVQALISLSKISAPLTIFILLVFAGPMSKGVRLTHRLLAGCLSSFTFLLLTYLTYLVRHGAVIGENLFASTNINTPKAFFPYYFSHLTEGYWMIHAATFVIPFLFIGVFYCIMIAAQRDLEAF